MAGVRLAFAYGGGRLRREGWAMWQTRWRVVATRHFPRIEGCGRVDLVAFELWGLVKEAAVCEIGNVIDMNK